MDNSEKLELTQNGFDQFELYRVRVRADGNCYFHAICMAYFIPYRTQKIGNKIAEREDIVKALRRDLALRLSALVDPEDPHSPTVYESLGNGHLAEMGTTNKEFDLDTLAKHIDSNSWCGEELQELISNETDKNIFYIDINIEDVYCSSNIDTLYKDRPSVVLIFDGNHYDTCAYRDRENNYITHFKFDHPLIQFLYRRLKIKKNM